MRMNGSIPQGTWFGPMAFIFLVIDQLPSCWIHKFVDDVTFSESFMHPEQSKMQSCVHYVSKTKEMIARLTHDNRAISLY